MMDAARLARIVTRFALTRADLVCIILCLRGHPHQRVERALYDFIRGVGPAAVMRARTPQHRTYPIPTTAPWLGAPTPDRVGVAA